MNGDVDLIKNKEGRGGGNRGTQGKNKFKETSWGDN